MGLRNICQVERYAQASKRVNTSYQSSRALVLNANRLALFGCVEYEHNFVAVRAEALAQLDEADPRVACRFELLDAEILVERNQTNNTARQALGKPPLKEESQVIEAMRAGLPACSGCAMGLDRLIMAAIGAKSIEEVIPFPTRLA